MTEQNKETLRYKILTKACNILDKFWGIGLIGMGVSFVTAGVINSELGSFDNLTRHYIDEKRTLQHLIEIPKREEFRDWIKDIEHQLCQFENMRPNIKETVKRYEQIQNYGRAAVYSTFGIPIASLLLFSLGASIDPRNKNKPEKNTPYQIPKVRLR